MARLTRKAIIAAVAKRTGLKPQYIDLQKANESDGGTYYWTGYAGSIFSEANSHIQKLNDWDLERWVDDAEHKIEESRPYGWETDEFSGKDMNKYIESMSWEVEFDD